MITRRTWLASALATLAAAYNPLKENAAPPDEPAPDLTDAQRLALRAVMNDAIANGEIPGGSLAVLSRGKLVFREAFGSADLKLQRPFTTDLPCYIASLTKPIVATWFVVLHDQGVVSLDDPVEKFLPEFKGIRVKGQDTAAKPPLVWHLLSQRSGLPGNSDKGAVKSYRFSRKSTDQPADGRPTTASAGTAFGNNASLADIVAGWARQGLEAEPGTRFAWGSSGYIVAARIAEVALRGRFEALFKSQFLDVLGMTHTTFRPDTQMLKLLPHRYLRTKAGLQDEKSSYPQLGPDALVNPAGGLFSTLDDLASFFMLHHNRGMIGDKRLVSAKSLERMYQAIPEPEGAARVAGVKKSYGRSGEEGPYSLGWNIVSDGAQVRQLGASGVMGWLDIPRRNAGVLLTPVAWEGNHQLISRVMKEAQALLESR